MSLPSLRSKHPGLLVVGVFCVVTLSRLFLLPGCPSDPTTRTKQIIFYSGFFRCCFFFFENRTQSTLVYTCERRQCRSSPLSNEERLFRRAANTHIPVPSDSEVNCRSNQQSLSYLNITNKRSFSQCVTHSHDRLAVSCGADVHICSKVNSPSISHQISNANFDHHVALGNDTNLQRIQNIWNFADTSARCVEWPM